jgi:hypothetical protein
MTKVDQFSEPDNGLASRRAVVRALGTAVLASGTLATACQAAAAHPDAVLLSLGAEFERLHAAWLPINAETWRLNSAFEKEWDKKGLSIDANLIEFSQLAKETGADAAATVEGKALDLLDALTAKIRETPAKTFAGLAVKARALRFDAHLSTQCDLPLEDQDWPEQVMNQFVAELDRLASTGA